MDQIAERTALTFCGAWDGREITAILSLLSDDVLYGNVPNPAMIGRAAVERFARLLLEGSSIFVVRNGLMAEWCDYADGETVAADLARAGVKLGGSYVLG